MSGTADIEMATIHPNAISRLVLVISSLLTRNGNMITRNLSRVITEQMEAKQLIIPVNCVNSGLEGEYHSVLGDVVVTQNQGKPLQPIE